VFHAHQLVDLAEFAVPLLRLRRRIDGELRFSYAVDAAARKRGRHGFGAVWRFCNDSLGSEVPRLNWEGVTSLQ
jgi:hypothetical protein